MLAKSIDARVRPQANGLMEKSSMQGAARVYVSKETMISLVGTIEHGKHCLVTLLESSSSSSSEPASPNTDGPQQVLQREAALWTLPEKNLSKNVVVMSTAFREATGFKVGDLIRLTTTGVTPDAQEVVVQDVTEKPENDPDRLVRWEKDAKYPVSWESLLAPVLGEFNFDQETLEAPDQNANTLEIGLIWFSLAGWWRRFSVASCAKVS
jgi:AAA family ATPase